MSGTQKVALIRVCTTKWLQSLEFFGFVQFVVDLAVFVDGIVGDVVIWLGIEDVVNAVVVVVIFFGCVSRTTFGSFEVKVA